jgi:outer membrane protein TolC
LELINNRPDVAVAEFRLREAYERVGFAKAMRYPSVNLGAGVGLNSFELDQLLNPAGSGFLLLNAVVFQPIFQKRRLKTNYEIALSEKKIAELEFRDKFLRAMNEVSDALVAIEKLKEEYVIAQERVTTARNAVKDAAFLFRSGLANYLEIITAQREALDSELNLENVKMRIFTADVELYRSLGGGWR